MTASETRETSMAPSPLGAETSPEAADRKLANDLAPHAAIAERGTADAIPQALTFDAVYHSYASFVWRNARRLGVPYGAVEDVMQEVFLVVHRRLPEFEERASILSPGSFTSMKAWLSAILIRVVRAHRRQARRKDGAIENAPPSPDPDSLSDRRLPSPLEAAERDEAVQELYAILSRMNEERREVLVLSELEELTAPEIAEALQVNVNTVSWRLGTARREFERMVIKRRAAQARQPR
jgi:RNA polymerase sigma-70 factor (ECF subfamily)